MSPNKGVLSVMLIVLVHEVASRGFGSSYHALHVSTPFHDHINLIDWSKIFSKRGHQRNMRGGLRMSMDGATRDVLGQRGAAANPGPLSSHLRQLSRDSTSANEHARLVRPRGYVYSAFRDAAGSRDLVDYEPQRNHMVNWITRFI